MSLKYRIAVIIFILEAIMMAVVLQQTQKQSYEASFKQINSNERAILKLVAGISKSALITEEYAELQPYVTHLISGTEASRLILADENSLIVVSSSTTDIGTKFPVLKDRPDYRWQVAELENNSGLMGYLAIEFSSMELDDAYLHAREFGITIALFGMLIIAAVGILVGFLLTRRLEIITSTARSIGEGDFTARTNINAQDEIGKLANTFDRMIERLVENKEELSRSLFKAQEKEENLTVTLNSIGDAVITTDAKGLITRMNPVAENLTGWSTTEAQAHSIKNVFNIIDASTRKEIDNPIDKVILTGETVYLSNHTTLIAKDGTEYQIADSAAPIRNANNQILGMVLIFNDVTEQYKMREKIFSSEQHLKLYREQAPMAIIEWDINFQIVGWNTAAEKMFGYSSDEVKKVDFVKVILPENVIGNVRQVWSELLAQTGGEFNVNENITKDGRKILCEWHNTILKGENGEIIGAASIVQDITERQLKEEKLRHTQKMDALGKLTGGVAHDFNNILGIVLGYAEVLKSKPNTHSNVFKYAEHIYHAGERGKKLTKKLLSLSRMKDSDNESYNINTILNSNRLVLEKTLTARIQLVFELYDDLWDVYIDVNDLEDALLNICINSMHAIEANGKMTFQTNNESLNEIDAQLLQVNPGEYVRLCISDTGHGMDAETKDKIFDPFFSTKGELGTGLGLSQVYGFVERSQGTIKVYSELNHGTRIILYFPRFISNGDKNTPINKNKENSYKGTETILVVDDEPALLDLTEMIVSLQGYQVFKAGSGHEALEILEQQDIDLILTDVIMPDMDGYQLSGIVSEKYPDIKIQLASGFSDDRQTNPNHEALNKNLLHKPFNSYALFRRLRELLD